MQSYPHRYTASAGARAIGSVVISAPALPPVETAPPPEFDGPGGTWSPETLLCAAVADCFVLTFRAVARAAHFNWITLDCQVDGVLEHIGNTTQFTRFATTARLTIPPGADGGKARRLLERAEHGCLIANSLRGERTLSIELASVPAESGPREPSGESTIEGIGRPAVAKSMPAETHQLS
jgi:organic hydroperoxide reductase OsmC/OhrA